METMSDKLSAFAAALRYEDIPSQVIEKVKLHVLDALGIGLASTEEPYAKGILAVAREWGGTPQATLLRYGDKLPAAHAAMVNGSLIHGIDFDDTHTESITHVSACVVPTALAVGEAAGAGGKEILAAMVAGYEIIARVGGAMKGGFHAKGYHATPICGIFGAVAVAGSLWGHTPEVIANAMGTAGSQASGIQEFLDDGSWAKRFHPGWACHAGITAAQLAGHGYLGPRKVFEGRFGLYATHVQDREYDPEVLAGGFGERWETLNISFKPYPCCHFNHAAMDAAKYLVREAGIRPEEIEAFEAVIPEPMAHIVCEPIESKKKPESSYAALFSLPYCMALNAVKGHAELADFDEENLGDPEVLALAGKFTYTTVDSDRFPKYLHGGVRMKLADGRTLEREEPVNWGNPENPMNRADVEEKFRGNAGRGLPPGRIQGVIDAVMNLGRGGGAAEVTAACRER
jgi:2-methylcitrate dehydratase PrpD